MSFCGPVPLRGEISVVAIRPLVSMVQRILNQDAGADGRGRLAGFDPAGGPQSQASGLTEGGADLFWVVTMSDLNKLRQDAMASVSPELSLLLQPCLSNSFNNFRLLLKVLTVVKVKIK